MTGQVAALRGLLKPRGTAPTGFGLTSRRPGWLAEPLSVGLWLAILVLYATFSALVWEPAFGVPHEADGYLSPFYAPFVSGDGFPAWLSPAIVTLWIPIGFRVTCYYFRRAYYRAYLADPPACAVGEPRIHGRYRMENALPFILQNVHRLFLYLAVILLAIHWIEVVTSFLPETGARIGLGSVLLLADITLLTGYVMSCHSMRHLVGGRLDCFSCSAVNRTRHGAWRILSGLNANHMIWAWASLFSIVLVDLYVHLLALGVLVDPAIRL